MTPAPSESNPSRSGISALLPSLCRHKESIDMSLRGSLRPWQFNSVYGSITVQQVGGFPPTAASRSPRTASSSMKGVSTEPVKRVDPDWKSGRCLVQAARHRRRRSRGKSKRATSARRSGDRPETAAAQSPSTPIRSPCALRINTIELREPKNGGRTPHLGMQTSAPSSNVWKNTQAQRR
jgi:hypothetical protein